MADFDDDENQPETSLPSSLTSSTSSTAAGLSYEPCSLCLRKSKNYTCEICILNGNFCKSKAKQSEIRIIEILEKREQINNLSEELLLKKEKIQCLHQVLQEARKAYTMDSTQLDALRDCNKQKQNKVQTNATRIAKLTAVRDQYRTRYSEDKENLVIIFNKLIELRKRTVSNTQQYLFPVEAIPVYPVMGTPPPHDLSILDTSQDIEVDDFQNQESVESALAEATQTSYVEGRWISKEEELKIEYSIVDSSCILQGNRDYTAFCQWVKSHRNGARGPDEEVGLRNPAFTICAGLSHTAQLLELLAYYFDVILPKKLTYSEFCHNELDKNEFRGSLSRLNANILHLCFSQHVDPTLLYWDRPLHNLYALLNSASIGRIGAFESYPEQLLSSSEQEKIQSDDSSDMEDTTNSESDTDWETLPKSADVPEDVPCHSSMSSSITFATGQADQEDGAGTTASLVTSAAASVAALWPWKR